MNVHELYSRAVGLGLCESDIAQFNATLVKNTELELKVTAPTLYEYSIIHAISFGDIRYGVVRLKLAHPQVRSFSIMLTGDVIENGLQNFLVITKSTALQLLWNNLYGAFYEPVEAKFHRLLTDTWRYPKLIEFLDPSTMLKVFEAQPQARRP